MENILLGTVFATLSAMNFNSGKYPGSYEIDMLNGASNYAKEYDGKNIIEPLEYIERTLHIIANNGNEDYKHYNELEKNVGEIKMQIREFTNIEYCKPIIRDICGKIEENFLPRKLDTLDWSVGMLTAISSLSFFLSGIFHSKRRLD